MTQHTLGATGQPAERPGPAGPEETERILHGLRDLAHRRGLEAVTMDRLAAHLGMSKRTIYRFYRSKRALVEALVDRLLDEIELTLRSIRGDGSEEASGPWQPVGRKLRRTQDLVARRIAGLNAGLLADLAYESPELYRRSRQRQTQLLREHLQHLLRQGVATRELRAQLEPELAAEAIVRSVLCVTRPEHPLPHSSTEPYPASELAAATFSLLFTGMLTASGHQAFVES